MSRGSRKHVLDWTDGSEFLVELLRIIGETPVWISAKSQWMPRGHRNPAEARLETFGPMWLPEHPAWAEIRKWWLVHEHGANTPNWDIALGCEIEGQPGLVLVEAKANVAELKVEGKRLHPKCSVHSRENHERIAAAIAEARCGLSTFESTVAISRDSHYQLANRVAFVWKLATLGIPTILVYLGFLGDDGIADVGAPFHDESDWRKEFVKHAASCVPITLFERRLECGRAPAWFLLRSRCVLEQSEPLPIIKSVVTA